MFCPCGSNKPLEGCCGPYLSGEKDAPTPEALMRSRYTAYSLGDLGYIERTMREKALNRFNRKASEKTLEQTTWIQLTVLNASEEGDTGTVQFMASFKDNGEIHTMHELSTFKKINNKWYYVDAEFN